MRVDAGKMKTVLVIIATSGLEGAVKITLSLGQVRIRNLKTKMDSIHLK